MNAPAGQAADGFAFPCPFCKHEIRADERQIGADIRCPACNELLTVPRPKAHLKVRGGSRKTSGPQKSENLTDLIEGKAFGEDRALLKARRARSAAARQVVVAIGLVVSLAVVVSGIWVYLDRKEKAKTRAQATRDAADRRHTYLRNLWSESKTRAVTARRQSPAWALNEPATFALWLALNELHPARPEAAAAFDAWVQDDAATGGLCSELFGLVSTAADIDPACQRLAGFLLGRHGDGTEAQSVERFRRTALKKAELASQGLLRQP